MPEIDSPTCKIWYETLRSCSFYTLRLRYEEKQVQVVAVLKSNMVLVTNLEGYLALNYSTMSKVPTFTIFFSKKIPMLVNL